MAGAMKMRKGTFVEERGSVLRWLLAQLWDDRVLLAAVTFTAFLMWLGGLPAGWVAFAAALLVLAGFARAERLEGRPSALPAATQRADTDPSVALSSIAALIDALDMPVLIVTSDETVRLQNRAAADLFGPIPRNADLSARIRAPGILDMAREVIATGRPKEIEHFGPMPSETVYIVRAAPMPALGQRLGGRAFLISFRDVSQAHKIEQIRSDFVANASHELRTPLASIAGFVETLRGPARNDANAREQFLQIMQNQTGRMARLIDDLLSLSRLEMKPHVKPGTRVDLHQTVEAVIASLAPLAADTGVVVEREFGEGPFEVEGDRDELFQVFQNLLENACKYGQSGGRVIVSMRRSMESGEPEIETTVRDFGPGIPAEHIPRVTERFYRVDVETSRAQKGTGLGLSIVKHILSRHDGRLSIRSELGKGSAFTVHLPAR